MNGHDCRFALRCTARLSLSDSRLRQPKGGRRAFGSVPLQQRPGEIRAGKSRDALAELFAQRPRVDLDHRAGRQFAKLERPVGHPDQSIDLEAERAKHVPDFAIFALRMAKVSHTLAPRSRSNVASIAPANAIDRDAVAQRVEPILVILLRAHA
jgi:hypothetical protein